MKLKKQIQAALSQGDYQTAMELGAGQTGQAIAALINSLYSTDDLLRWRAVECLGLLTKQISLTEPAQGREIIRRLLWALNDESGGSGWASTEAVGEIIRNRPDLYQEFVSIIVSFREDPALIGGIIWGLGRIGEIDPALVNDYLPFMHELLDDPDPQLRGLALWALQKIKATPPTEQQTRLKADPGECRIFENKELTTYKIAQLV
ncbi:MAG: HEAT repeat domain-containing protein [Firmicutes bacterium]|nr:HEAT repeat domain-containing protein [Bacillota bacterium]